MATATAAPPLAPRYEARNSLTGKWSPIARRAVWMFLFIYAFVMIGLHYVHVRLVPTIKFTLEPNLMRRPDDFWMILGVALLTGTFVGLLMTAAMAMGVTVSYVAVHPDRLQIKSGIARRDVMFRDILGVELIHVSSWPRRGHIWSDIKSQFQYLFGTMHWMQHGLSQFFRSQATLVLVKVAGRRWVRGYLLDVDDPARLLAALDDAITDYVGANGPEHLPGK